jgi:large subunit ribosomal protein L30
MTTPVSHPTAAHTAKQIRITLEKSLAGQLRNIAASVRGLGLRRRHQTVTVANTAENRGMVNVASHMLKVDYLEPGHGDAGRAR